MISLTPARGKRLYSRLIHSFLFQQVPDASQFAKSSGYDDEAPADMITALPGAIAIARAT
jgi:hypothetical protein